MQFDELPIPVTTILTIPWRHERMETQESDLNAAPGSTPVEKTPKSAKRIPSEHTAKSPTTDDSSVY
jgi:hypothetical protein